MAKLIKKGILSGKSDYQLSGFQGVEKYAKDYTTLPTFGFIGNLAVTYLGSYGLTWSVVKINGKEATVLFEVKNSSTIQSATRPPVLGYTSLWQNTVGNSLNNSLSSRPLSKTTQQFVWTKKITIK